MKDLYVIGGPAGVGKTAVCGILKRRLDNCVFLDGDWVWDSEPLLITEETKRTAVQNIIFLLDSYIRCPDYSNIVFCWDLNDQETIDEILMWINHRDCAVRKISLICSEQTLRDRLGKEVESGRRSAESLEKSVRGLSLYERLDSYKIDVSEMSPEEAANAVLQVPPAEIRFR